MANSALPRFILETVIIAPSIGILYIRACRVKGTEVQLFLLRSDIFRTSFVRPDKSDNRRSQILLVRFAR
jgi:hypothetical protein